MAFFQMNYHSDALRMGVSVNVIIPERAGTLIGMKADGGDSYKTLYLLHGLSDDHTIWMRRTSIERYAADYGIAVVMPSVGRSWYTDTLSGAKYFTFVADELPRVCRSYFCGMSDKREDNLIAGLSMGGYGALKVALTYPERFCGCASLSGALDVAGRRRPYSVDEEWRAIFGILPDESSALKGTGADVFHLAAELKKNGKQAPKIYLWCGTEDSLLDANVAFTKHLTELQIPHTYEQSEGNHSWRWWDLHVQDALKALL